MHIINDQIYYHLQTKEAWKTQWSIGEKYTIGEEQNPFFAYYNTNGRAIKIGNQKYSVNQVASEWIDKYLTGHSVFGDALNIKALDMVKALNSTLDHYLKLTREIVFEEVRYEINPELPSRQRGLWLLTNDNISESVQYWKGQLNQEVRLLKLLVNGRMHRGASYPLIIRTEKLNNIRELARKYWSENQVHRFDDELIFEGTIEVMEITAIV